MNHFLALDSFWTNPEINCKSFVKKIREVASTSSTIKQCQVNGREALSFLAGRFVNTPHHDYQFLITAVHTTG
ncbi:hypothetical protein BsWGS_17742 [Bradybaena similaris]